MWRKTPTFWVKVAAVGPGHTPQKSGGTGIVDPLADLAPGKNINVVLI